MKPERGRSFDNWSEPKPLAVEECLEISQILGKGKFEDLNKNQQHLLKIARAYLNVANEGIQWLDFNNKKNSRVGSNLEAYSRVRADVIGALFPLLFSDKPMPSLRLSDDIKVVFQTNLKLLVNLVILASEGLNIASNDKRIISLGVSFFEKLGQPSSFS